MAAATVASRPRRLLVALATMLAAVSIAAASGATFNASSANTANGYTAGTLTMTNSKANAAVFNQSNLKPGDTVIGTVTITNSGTLPATYELVEEAVNPFTGDLLSLVITDTASGAEVYRGTFGKAATQALGQWAPGEARTLRFATTLASGASNAEQGKSASATYTWNAVQTAGEVRGG
jgi:spore coat-associated protein N